MERMCSIEVKNFNHHVCEEMLTILVILRLIIIVYVHLQSTKETWRRDPLQMMNPNSEEQVLVVIRGYEREIKRKQWEEQKYNQGEGGVHALVEEYKNKISFEIVSKALLQK